MPNAMVATITTGSPERKRMRPARFSSGDRPAWKGIAGQSRSRSERAMRSVLLRLPQYTIDASPLWRPSSSISWFSSEPLGRAAMWRLARWKLATSTSASGIASASMMSARVRGSAVAVSAMRGTPGRRSGSCASRRYSGRNSWPQADTQCASSMAITEISMRDRRSSMLPDSRRSGDT